MAKNGLKVWKERGMAAEKKLKDGLVREKRLEEQFKNMAKHLHDLAKTMEAIVAEDEWAK